MKFLADIVILCCIQAAEVFACFTICCSVCQLQLSNISRRSSLLGQKVGQWAPRIRWLALPRRDLRRSRSLRPAAWQRPTAPEDQDEDQDKDRDEVGDAGDEGDLETGDSVQLRRLLINFA